jgi:hypothetical protein
MRSPTSRLVWCAAALALATAWSASTTREVSSVGPQKVDTSPPSTEAGPFVPSGTLLSVRVDQPVDSFYTAPGSPFTATVLSPLRDTAGRTLVDEGAKVHGTFATFGSPSQPRVRLALKSIETVHGRAPLTAVVRSAQHLAWVPPPAETPQQTHRLSYDLFDYHDQIIGTSGPGTARFGYQPEPPHQVLLPESALVMLQLAEPLFLPNGRNHPR